MSFNRFKDSIKHAYVYPQAHGYLALNKKHNKRHTRKQFLDFDFSVKRIKWSQSSLKTAGLVKLQKKVPLEQLF